MPRIKGVWPAGMHECIVGMHTVSLRPKMGAERRAQVAKSFVFAESTRDSASACYA